MRSSLTNITEMRLNKVGEKFKMAYVYNDELQHYGVLGMKWGVRRATNRVKKATKRKSYDKGIASLNKHKEKSKQKISKLEKQSEKLKAQRHKDITVNKARVAQMEAQAARYRRKANSMLNTEISSYMRNRKASKFESNAAQLNARMERTKSQIVKNADMRKTFNTAIADIDKTLIDYGKRILED